MKLEKVHEKRETENNASLILCPSLINIENLLLNSHFLSLRSGIRKKKALTCGSRA